MDPKKPEVGMSMDPDDELVVEELPCALTNAELLAVGQRIADAITAKHAAAERMKAETASLRKEIREHERLVNELQQMLATKRETRPVTCALVADGVRLTVRTLRLDTNEVIGERPMTADERQARLFRERPVEAPCHDEAPRRGSRKPRRAA